MLGRVTLCYKRLVDTVREENDEISSRRFSNNER